MPYSMYLNAWVRVFGFNVTNLPLSLIWISLFVCDSMLLSKLFFQVQAICRIIGWELSFNFSLWCNRPELITCRNRVKLLAILAEFRYWNSNAVLFGYELLMDKLLLAIFTFKLFINSAKHNARRQNCPPQFLLLGIRNRMDMEEG